MIQIQPPVRFALVPCLGIRCFITADGMDKEEGGGIKAKDGK